MRVVHLVNETIEQRVNGYTIRTQRIVEAQRRAGLEVEVRSPATYGEVVGLGDALLGVPQFTGIEILRACPSEAAALAGLLTEIIEDDEVIHAHAPWPCALAAIEHADTCEKPGRFVYEVRGLQEESAVTDGRWARTDDRYRVWRACEDDARREAEHVFAISPGLADDARARGASRVTITPNAVDVETFVPISRDHRNAVRQGYRLPVDAPIVGYIGSLRPLENVEELIRAMPIVRERSPRAELLVCGSGPNWGELAALAESLGLRDVAHFRGPIEPDAVPSLLASIDCVAITRADEPVTRMVTPLKPLEALACCVPVVSSDLPALRYVGERGTLFYSPGDLDDLASQIMHAFRRPSLGDEGRAWVERERTWAHVVKAQIAAYEEMMR